MITRINNWGLDLKIIYKNQKELHFHVIYGPIKIVLLTIHCIYRSLAPLISCYRQNPFDPFLSVPDDNSGDAALLHFYGGCAFTRVIFFVITLLFAQ